MVWTVEFGEGNYGSLWERYEYICLLAANNMQTGPYELHSWSGSKCQAQRSMQMYSPVRTWALSEFLYHDWRPYGNGCTMLILGPFGNGMRILGFYFAGPCAQPRAGQASSFGFVENLLLDWWRLTEGYVSPYSIQVHEEPSLWFARQPTGSRATSRIHISIRVVPRALY